MSNNSETTAKPGIYNFRLWWGIVAAGLIIVLILLVGPYSAHIVFSEKPHALWYLWQLYFFSTSFFLKVFVCMFYYFSFLALI